MFYNALVQPLVNNGAWSWGDSFITHSHTVLHLWKCAARKIVDAPLDAHDSYFRGQLVQYLSFPHIANAMLDPDYTGPETKLALIRLSFTRDPRNRASFRTANSTAVYNRICSAPCEWVVGAQVKKIRPFKNLCRHL